MAVAFEDAVLVLSSAEAMEKPKSISSGDALIEFSDVKSRVVWMNEL